MYKLSSRYWMGDFLFCTMRVKVLFDWSNQAFESVNPATAAMTESAMLKVIIVIRIVTMSSRLATGNLLSTLLTR
jgi:hypothetical protein